MDSPDLEQIRDEDAAATMRARGVSWARIAVDLGISSDAAKLYVAASDQRVKQHHDETQIALFDLGS